MGSPTLILSLLAVWVLLIDYSISARHKLHTTCNTNETDHLARETAFTEIASKDVSFLYVLEVLNAVSGNLSECAKY